MKNIVDLTIFASKQSQEASFLGTIYFLIHCNVTKTAYIVIRVLAYFCITWLLFLPNTIIYARFLLFFANPKKIIIETGFLLHYISSKHLSKSRDFTFFLFSNTITNQMSIHSILTVVANNTIDCLSADWFCLHSLKYCILY